MGIKFHCPNGHKLNVKSFLAGKKGVCPKCGTKVRIPAASEPGLANADLEEADASAIAQPGGNGSAAPAAVATTQRAMAPAVPVGTPVGVPASQAGAATIPAATPTSAAGDPIAEAPAAIWYVRPPGGGQYGPARGDVMRRWIAEGRVSGDSLIWREGWTDWRNAAQLFPSLGAGAAAAAASPATAAPPADVAALPRTTRSATRYRTKKSSGSGLAIAALVALAILCVALVGVLVYVLTNVK